MDAQRCFKLHNEILRHSWIGSGRAADEFESRCRTWTDYYGTGAEEARPDLSADLFAFLQGARVCDDGFFSFSYWVCGLSSPGSEGLSYCRDLLCGCSDDEGERKRYVVLYVMSGALSLSHTIGLVFDQKTHLSILCPTMDEVEVITNGRVAWYPLETVLQAWLNMIHDGHLEVIPKEMGNGWVLHIMSERMLRQTLDAFDKLVQAIEARLPCGSRAMPHDKIDHGLVEESALQLVVESTGLHGFPVEFLRRARRPRFSMVAPGLELPSSLTLMEQLYGSYLCLFRSRSIVDTNSISCQESHYGGHRYTGQPPTYNAGVYILGPTKPWDTDDLTYADEFTFVLPYGIGARGFARRSDGSLFGDSHHSTTTRPEDAFADLYQPGYQPFEDYHQPRLVTLLENWGNMVERGDWEVDEHGVAGGMHLWREADTEHGWQKVLWFELSGIRAVGVASEEATYISVDPIDGHLVEI